MKVFISWSGERSKAVARALRSWIPGVFQNVDPWMSEKDIEAGAMWLNEIMAGLQEASFGIVCITPENQNAPWLHFEAGAIAKEVGVNLVCPYLFSLSGSQFQNNPLIHFQYKQANETGTKEIVESINKVIEKPINQDILSQTFELWWPKLDQQLNDIPEPDAEPENERSPQSMLEELLGLVRQMSRSLPNLYTNTSYKMIDMLLQELSPKEERVLRMLYGLGGETAHNHDEVGHIFGIDAMRIMDVEAQAMDKIRNRYPLFFKGIEDTKPF